MDEQKDIKKVEQKETVTDSDTGDKPKEPQVITDANTAAERLEKANKEKKELLDREEEMMAKKRLYGTAEAGIQPVKPTKMTDTEYTEAYEKGEVDPFKEDGIAM